MKFAILPVKSFSIMKRVSFWGFILCISVLAARGDIIPTLSSTSLTGGNFVAGSNNQPAGWTFSSSLVGTTPSLVKPTDNHSILNLTWTYTGTMPINGSAPLGIFSIVAKTNLLRTSDFAAEGTRTNGPNGGSKVDNIGNIS